METSFIFNSITNIAIVNRDNLMQQQIIDLTETNTKVIQSLYPDFTSRNIDGVVVNLLLTPDFIMHVRERGTIQESTGEEKDSRNL
ncbi:MAG: hypothetical protein ACJ71B_05825 [Nitrososphaera sp.]